MIRRRRFLQTMVGGATTMGVTQGVAGLDKPHSAKAEESPETSSTRVTLASLWRRDDRTFVYQHEGRTRYPSVASTAAGRLLVLFTRQTAEQEKQDAGDLVLISRSPDGRWWIRPRVVFSGQDGVPRAVGTMTTLADGRIVAPFVVLRSGGAQSALRLLESKDYGETWAVSAPIQQKSLAWAAPNGRPFELRAELVVPVFGAPTADDLAKTRHSCGLLRSRDGGKSWKDWSLIASGSTGEFSFEYPAVLPLGEGRLVAVVTARRLAHGIKAPQVLMRTFSRDGGHTWTPPEQMAVGAWPALASVGREVVCAYTLYCPWAELRLLVSQDGLKTFSQDQSFVEHGWLPNMDHYPKVSLYPDKQLQVEKGRSWWAYHPLPLPPVVPHLGGDWGSGHYGFPSVLALSDKRLLITLGNMQRGSVYTDPPAERNVPIEYERIEAIGFDRIGVVPAPQIKRVQARDRWEVVESWTPEKWSQVVMGGAGGYDTLGGGSATEFISPPLKSGRLIKVTFPLEKSDSHVMKIVGRERGYWVMHQERHLDNPKPQFMYSDDKGKTWHEGNLTSVGPLARMYFPFGKVIEGDEGTLFGGFYGYQTQQDELDCCYCSALVRSRDGGRTWGDWSLIGRDPNRIWSYCEPTLLTRPDGVWVAIMRTETPANQPWMGAMMCRSVSLDKGRTWSEPKPSVVGSQPATLILPGGQLAFVVRSTGRQAPGVYISSDLGETWDYALEGAYNTSMAGLLDEDRFWVWANNEALIYRRLRA